MDSRCIAFCDSGVGGLPLLKRVVKAFPNENFVYYADTKNMPYGNKTEGELAEIYNDVILKLTTFAPKLIVTACNTLSTLNVGLKKYTSVKVIGVTPVAGEGKGCLLCTPRTAESSFVKGLKRERCTVVGAEGLAEKIEDDLLNGREPSVGEWADVIPKDIDYLSLGCTHYEFLSKKYEQMFENAKIIDGSAVAERKIGKFIEDFPSDKNRGKICFLGNKKSKISDIFYNFQIG